MGYSIYKRNGTFRERGKLRERSCLKKSENCSTKGAFTNRFII